MAKKSAAKGESPPAKGKGDNVAEKNSAYVVFARRFRPNSFSEVAGQAATTGALKQALTSGRLAQAYLFCGPRGVGKTSLARIVAKALNCLKGKGPGGVADEPCNECDACLSIQEGRALDVIEMDAATNRGIEEVRSLRDRVGLSPAELRYKVYIIDEVHMLTKEAWNAFLKTLEEPPAHVKFIFATTDPNNVPETILSRCQRYDLRRIGPADIVKRLKQICELENVEFDEMALSRIAALSRGGLRDAEGLLDQAVNLGQGKVTDEVVRDLSGAAPDELVLEMLKACAQGKTAEVLQKSHAALEAGADPEDILTSLIDRLRGTLLSKICGADSPLLEGQTHLKTPYAELAGLLSEDQMLMLIQVFAASRRQMRDASQTRLPLEMALIRASRAGDLVDLGKLVSTLETSGLRAPSAGAAQSRPPTSREGPRPNSPGRPEGTVESRQAANPSSPPFVQGGIKGGQTFREAPPRSPLEQRGEDTDAWSQVIAAVRGQKGGAMLASGLTHAASVKLDGSAATLSIGFAAEQLLYKESLERAANKELVLQALQNVFGKSFTLSVERVTANTGERVINGVASARPAPAPVAKPARPSPPPPASDDYEPEPPGDLETEVEFDGAGELPLPRAKVPVAEEEAQASFPENEDGDEAPQRATVRPPLAAARFRQDPPRMQASPGDFKAVEDHPLVKIVMKETQGTLMNVTHSAPKKSPAAKGEPPSDAKSGKRGSK